MMASTIKGFFAFTLLRVKKWLAYILFIIFSFQILPVKELGKLLCKGQLTEEVQEEALADTEEEPAGAKLKKEAEQFKFHNSTIEFVARTQYYGHNIMVAIHEADHLPLVYLPDIPTPPPNCLQA